jgi:dipeptidyl aminopeptidase/acylaminoacyl peptidase
MRAASLISLGLVCAAVSAAARADEPDDLRTNPLAAAFGTAPLIWSPRLSPDGARVAQIQMHPSGVTLARVLDITTGTVTALIAGTGDESPVQGEVMWCGWKNDTRLLCAVRTLGTSKTSISRMVGIDRDGGNVQWFPRANPRGPYPLRLVDWLPDDPERVLVMVRNPNAAGVGVARLNVYDGATTDENQGPIQIFDWITDSQGAPRLYRRTFANRVSWYVRDTLGPAWNLLHEKAVDDPDDPFTPMGFGERRNELLVLDDYDGRRALFALDLEQNRSRRLVYAHEGFDVSGLLSIGKNERFVAVTYIDDRLRYEFLDARVAEIHAQLEKHFAGKAVSIVDEDWNRRYYLILVDAADDAGTYFRYDSERNALLKLLPAYGSLADRELAPVREVTYLGIDGAMVRAYLTLPKATTDELPPAVVLPHDGPASRDYLRFDFLAQYLAASGYAVLQPNYRGSTGYGNHWEGPGGYRDWLGAVEDIAEGTRYLARQRIVDEKRICIIGWGYGGYAALMSVIEHQGQYRCVVSIAGVTDPRMQGNLARNYYGGQAAEAFIGTDRYALDVGSPLERVNAIRVPVLLFHGERSVEVLSGQSAQLARALEKAGKDVELVRYEDAEYDIRPERYRVDLLVRLRGFLDAHLSQ